MVWGNLEKSIEIAFKIINYSENHNIFSSIVGLTEKPFEEKSCLKDSSGLQLTHPLVKKINNIVL